MTEVEPAIDGRERVAPLSRSPESSADYERLVEALDEVLDAGGADETSPLAPLAELLGDRVAEWEHEHLEDSPPASGIEMLRHLMREHGLSQSDLPEIGSQGVVSETLRGKRPLNLRQIRGLAERFGVPAGWFVG
ncbi:helix-turn-helix domain-containing protein [Endothiovibrio diazotrophicus]